MRKLFLLIFIVLTKAFYLEAQSPIFKKYTIDDGLPSSETYCAVQDKKGYMWFATDRGLAKFDGYNFRIFTTNDGMPDNTVFELFVGDDNTIWFKTITSELGYIKNDTGYSYKYNPVLRHALAGYMINHILFANNNHILFARLNGNQIIFFEINAKGELKNRDNIDHDSLKRIYINKVGQQVSTGNSMAKHFEVYLQETNKKIGDFYTPTAIQQTFSCASKSGNAFFLYINKFVFHLKNGKCEKIIDCGDAEVLSISSDKNDNLFVGYRSIGFVRYDAKNGYKKNLTALNNNSISSICADNEGGYWFTSLENGVYYLPPSQLMAYTEEHGLQIAKVLKIENIDNNILAILSNSKVLIKSKDKKNFTVIGDNNEGYGDIEYDNKNTLYIIGEKSAFLSKINKKRIISLKTSKRIHIGYHSIWTQDYQAVTRYNRDGEALNDIPTGNLPWSTCLHELEDSSLLVGTVSGLYRRVKGQTFPLKNINPLLAARISSIIPFKNYLLISTIGQGILILKKDDYTNLTHFTTANGLSSMICNVVMISQDSVIWVATNRGLSVMKWPKDMKNAYFSVIDNNDGIPSNEINNICFVGDDLWLATAKGISIVPRNKATSTLPDIPMYIERVTVNGKIIDSQHPQTLLYYQNNVNIFFTGLHYTHAGKLQYKYRVKGDTNWYFTSNRTVVLNGLQPGKYTFEVMVFKANGQLSTKLAKYSFTILPPFWQTWWFITLTTLFLLVFLIVVIYKIITIKKEEVYKKAQLDRKLAQLELEAIKAQINPHFIYNCLNSIQYFNYSNDYTSVKKYFGLLARLIRQTMKFSHETFITLEAEVNYLSNYLELEKVRFKEKLSYQLDVSPELKGNTLMPAMLIQPYVENALKHGIANLKNNGNVWIKFSALPNNSLLVVVEDNGPGFKIYDDDIEGIHFGSRLTQGRITNYNQLFGLGIGIKVMQKELQKGLRIEITIPTITNDNKSRKNSN